MLTLVELCVVGVLCVLVTAMTVDQRRRDALGVGTLQGDMRLLAPVWSEAHHYGISSNTVAGSDSSTSHSDWAIPMSSMYQCQYPGCQKESAFDPNTGAQNEYCHEHIQYTQMLQDDIPTAAAASTVWGRVLGSAFTSWFQSQTQRALSNVIRSQHILSLHKRTQSARSETVLARPVTASPGQVQQSITMPQVTLVQAQQAIPVPQTIPGQQICKLPGCNHPRYVKPGGKVHDFCGKTHAQLYELQHAASTPNLPLTAYGTCSLPGCKCPKYRDPANGRIHDYCGRTHTSLARAQGLQPSNSSMIRQANQQEFSKVSQQFTKDWNKRRDTCPKVNFVYVVSNSALEARWRVYRQTLQDQTVEEYYHGTKLICNLSNMPCTNTDCGVCGISSMGLDRRCIRKNINFQRFGHGFYLTSNSSKCHDYTQDANGYRAMLLCAVCPGRKYILQTDHVSLKGPPQGFDCVYGQEGSSLNYAEIVVYNPDAVLPRYIIVYQRDGVHKIAR